MADFPVNLSYHSFGAPGCGGVSRLSVGLTAAGDIAVIDALPSEYDDEEDSGDIVYLNPVLSKAPPAKPAPPVLQAAWSPRSIPITHNRIVPMIHAVPAAPGTTRRSAPIPMAHAVPAAPGTTRRSAPMYSSGCGCRRR